MKEPTGSVIHERWSDERHLE